MSIYEQLGEVIEAQRSAALALEECPHLSTHTERVEYDQGPEEQSLYVQDIEVCDSCGEVVEMDV